jgi:5-hydroxyisourate hydrolase-like protein (transthyretin family)
MLNIIKYKMTEAGCLKDGNFQNLQVSGGVRGVNRHTVESMAGAAAAEAVVASTIKKNTTLLLYTVGTDADDRIYLPRISDVPLGHVITILEVTATPLGYELAMVGDGTTAGTINGTAGCTAAGGTYAKELAIPATAVQVICIKTSSVNWKVISQAATGADNVSGTADA